MKVGDYYIGWRHSWQPVAPYTSRIQMTTMCTLYKNKEVIHHVHVGNHQSDEPNKEAGRKASLNKLLNQLKVMFPDIFHRKFRAEIWETYRTLTKEPRWKLRQKDKTSTSPSDSATEEKSTQAIPSPTQTATSPS